MIHDYFFLAFAHLRHHPTRAWLTMIGIFIGIAAVVALISLGQGLQDAINSQFSTFGVDKIIVTGKSAGFGPPGQASAGKVTKADIQLLRKSPGIMRTAGRLLKPVSVDFANEVRTTYAVSLPEDDKEFELIKEVNTLRAAEGRMLKKGDKRKAMVGYDLAYKLVFSHNIKLGSKLLLNEHEYGVIGVMDRFGDPARDKAIYLMENDMRNLFDMKNEYSVVVAQLASGENPRAVAEVIKRAMGKDRHQKVGKEDFEIQTSEEILRQLTTILQIVSAVLTGIAAISLLVGGVGIMNTMYTAVLERTREIGIMKAIGARNEDILAIFLVESGMLGMTGGGLGILLGTALSKATEFVAAQMWGPNLLQASIPWYLVLGALLFSFITGTLSGVLPARKAAHMKPSEALQYE